MEGNKVFYQLGQIRWALHQLDGLKNFMEIDIQPQFLANEVVIRALFQSGRAPNRVEISSELRVNDERYRIDYSKAGYNSVLSTMAPQFTGFIYFAEAGGDPHLYLRGWRQRFAQQALEDAKSEAIHLEWRNTPHPSLGGLTPDQIVDRGYGPLEIPNVGFVWVGIDTTSRTRGTLQIQTRPYSTYKNFDDCLRWFMQRGTSLNQALRLNSQHMGQLNQQALIGSIKVLLGALKSMPGKSIPLSIMDKTLHTAKSINKTLGATTKLIKRSNVGAEIMSSKISIESKVQLLNKVEPIAIPTL